MKANLKNTLAAALLAAGCSLPASAQLQWSSYNNTGALVTPNVASGGDATYGNSVALTIPASTERVFMTTTFVPIGVPVASSSVKINFSMNANGGLYPGNTGRLWGMGLLKDPGTPANALDDTGYWTDFNTGNPSFELFDRPATVSTFFQYDSADKLSTGKTATGYPTNNVTYGMQFQLNMNSAGTSVSMGTSSSSWAACGAGMTNGNGTVNELAYSGTVSLTTLATTNFNEFAFMFNNLSASPVTVTLSGITLVPANPVVAGAPVGYSGSPGDNTPTTAFAVSVSTNSAGPLAFQWYQATTLATNLLVDGVTANGSTLAGTTTSNLTFVSAQPGDSADYFVVVTNTYGSVTSSPALLNISASATAPVITSITTTNATVVSGTSTNITVAATGAPSPVFFWYDNNGNLLQAGASPLLSLTNVTPSAAGVYSVTASNSVATATTNFTLVVLTAPSISSQPASLLLNLGDPASFSVTASGVPAPTYQWYDGSTPIPAATNATFAIASVALTDIGAYHVAVTNAAGHIASSNAVLAIYSTITGTPLTPANNAAGVCYDTPLSLVFSQPVSVGNTGKVRIYNVTNSATPVDTLDLSLNAPNGTQAHSLFAGDNQPFNYYPIIASGNMAVIYPHSGVLTSNQTYYVTVEPGVILDSAGAYFAGINGSNVWQFTTKVGGPANPLNPIVAADGSGDFATVQGAVDSLPASNTVPTLINIQNGNYVEIVDIAGKNNVTFRGQSRTGVIVGYANNVNVAPNGTTHARMAFKVDSKNIAIENLTISNSTPQGGGQAEALMIESGASHFILNNAEVDSRQDTILANVNSSQGYFYNSLIQGNYDYIWGGGNLFFTNCELRTITGVTLGNLTASRTDNGVNGNWAGYLGLYASNGFSFVNCQLTRQSSTVTNCSMADANGSTNGNAVWINCAIDTGCYVNPLASAANSQLLWEYGNSNLTDTVLLDNTAPPFVGCAALTVSDPRFIAAASATNWLNGWQPQLAPNIVSQPTNETVLAGQTAVFAVTATGIPDATYQWFQNGTNAPYPGADTSTLTIPNAQSTDASTLSVVVSNTAGTVTSSSVTLAVTTPSPVVFGNVSFDPAGGVQFGFTGTTGFGYRIWATTDITLTPIVSTWTLVGSNTFDGSPVIFSDPQATNYPQRFYTVTVP